MPGMKPIAPLLLAAAALLQGCANAPASQPSALDPLAQASAPPRPQACPREVPADARCFVGEDGRGSHYWIALPAGWQPATGVLVMHAHGGPADTGPSRPERSEEDLKRWAVTVKAGHAWSGSTYRRGGYGVTMAAQDTELLRQIFVRHFGAPRRTLLHGQSYGGGVAAKAAELYATVDGRRGPYDGVLLTSGVLGGGTRAYEFRLDLRAVYQAVCRNHPRPDEPQYPLWMGLPEGSTLTREELARRVNECTGVRLPAAQRTPQQATRLAAIVNTLRIPESSLVGHLNWATWLFRDLTQLRLGGRNPFSNVGAQYRGSADDAALNAAVPRYAADAQAVAQLAHDSRPEGRVNVPVLTLHAIHDPTAFVELESEYRDILQRAGTGHLLVQTFSEESEHSYLGEVQYPALFESLLAWIDHGRKPTPQSVLALCKALEPRWGAGCRIRPDYQPAPLDSRVASRAGR
jgi:alpha-beta hydrolase superfamily lysophospholipase